MYSFSKKGGAGTLGYNDMTAVTQILETLLDKLRKKEVTLTGELASVLQEAGEVIATQSAIHRDGGKVDAYAVSAMCAKLERFLLPPNPADSDNNADTLAAAGGAADQPDDPNYGFFGGTPQLQQESEAQDDDYGFFKDKPSESASKVRHSK